MKQSTKKPTDDELVEQLHEDAAEDPKVTKLKGHEVKKSMFISAKDSLSKAMKNPKTETAQQMFDSVQKLTAKKPETAQQMFDSVQKLTAKKPKKQPRKDFGKNPDGSPFLRTQINPVPLGRTGLPLHSKEERARTKKLMQSRWDKDVATGNFPDVKDWDEAAGKFKTKAKIARRKAAGPIRVKQHDGTIKNVQSLDFEKPETLAFKGKKGDNRLNSALLKVQKRGIEKKAASGIVGAPAKKPRTKTGPGAGGHVGKGSFKRLLGELGKSVLTTEDREDLKQKQFALPKKADDKQEKAESGNYPIPDLSHARSALAMVAMHGTPAEQSKVRAAVYKKYPELDKRKEEDQEKSMFISAKDSLNKARKKPKATVGYPAVKEERITAQQKDMVSVYDKAGKLIYRGAKAGAPGPNQKPVPKKVVKRQGNWGVVNRGTVGEEIDAAKKVATNKAQKASNVAVKGAMDVAKQQVQQKDGYQLGDFAKQKKAPIKPKVPMKKSLDPALAARMNMQPMSVPGAMGHPEVGQIGFYNTTIAANFASGSNITMEERALPVLKRPIK